MILVFVSHVVLTFFSEAFTSCFLCVWVMAAD